MSQISTRRQFVASAAALPWGLRAMAKPSVRGTAYVLLGTDKGQGIYRAAWNASNGELGKAELAIATGRPTYFAVHPKKPVLYAALELNVGDGKVASFAMDAQAAELKPLGEVSSTGNGPCYVSVDQTGQTVFVANYGGGSVAPLAVQKDGSLGAAAGGLECKDNVDCGVPGPVKDRQDAAHLHCAVVSPDNRYLLVCNLGEDAIEVIPIAPGLPASEVFGQAVRVGTRAGSGPRHVVFHPEGKWVYCIHELDCTVDAFAWTTHGRSSATIALIGGSTVSLLRPGTPLTGNTGCEIVMSHDGRFIYANVRGTNELLVYRVNAKTGLLTEQQRVQTGGTVTRLIALDPSRRWLLCMNQGSDTVTVFAHDEKTGKLGDGTPNARPKIFAANSPMCVAWI